MNSHFVRHVSVLCLVGISLLSMGADAPAREASLATFKAGAAVSGPAVKGPEALAGKLVYIDYWGITCGPCLAGIPHVCELADKYSRDELVVIANQAWAASVPDVRTTWNQHAGGKGKNVTVLNNASIAGVTPHSFPSAYLFGPDGKLIWSGYPGGADQMIEKQVEAVRKAAAERKAEAQAALVRGANTAIALLGDKAPAELKSWSERRAKAGDDAAQVAKLETERAGVAKAIGRAEVDEPTRQKALSAYLAPAVTATWTGDAGGKNFNVIVDIAPACVSGMDCQARLLMPEGVEPFQKLFPNDLKLSPSNPTRTMFRSAAIRQLPADVKFVVELRYGCLGFKFSQQVEVTPAAAATTKS